MTTLAAPVAARRIHIRGVVQGVGFRPHVFRLADAHRLRGWVVNGDDGVRIHVEGSPDAIAAFVAELTAQPPPAAVVSGVDILDAESDGLDGFEILESESQHLPTTRISPDLPVCEACLAELFDPSNRRYLYPYINCTNCGPRFSIVKGLPYDRAETTMAPWALCDACAAEYHDPRDRRFHAQPIACPACGPTFKWVTATQRDNGSADPIGEAARMLRDGGIVAVKGIGGYHLACAAENAAAVAALRARKFRKEQPFAVMVRDVSVAEQTVELTDEARALLTFSMRPIVLAPARAVLEGVAPDHCDFGVMLPYTPLHHLLFAAGAPDRLVMTSGNRSSEPIAFEDEDARRRLDGLADAWLIGERPIARRVDDSVARAGALGQVVLRRSRGAAPGAVASLPTDRTILAFGGDLKNTVTLVVDGQAYVSQHVGDLSHHAALEAFRTVARDLIDMYELSPEDLTIVHDAHPQYVSSMHAAGVGGRQTIAVQHHRAHVASVLAERGDVDRRVVGVALDGTGYGDDGSIWGGEFFVGSIRAGFERVAHLWPALLPGGDAAARYPVQAAAGFLSQLDDVGDLSAPPINFPDRYQAACAVVRSGIRTFPTTSAGRLFDAVAALLGFTRPVTFEGQAAMWLEHLARRADAAHAPRLPLPHAGNRLDWRPTLSAIVNARRSGTDPAPLALAFHRAFGESIAGAIRTTCEDAGIDTAVLSGGVMQNALLLDEIRNTLASSRVQLWINHAVPPNDGGLSLGQAAMAL
jgi:hydrogenase maturation protein HypF